VTAVDPLISVERTATLELAVSQLRHDLRNRLAAIRNAAFYIRRRTSGLPGAADDARVPRFFDLIEQELELATALLGARPLDDRDSSEASASMRDVVDTALDSARVAERLEVDVRVTDTMVAGDRLELAVAVRVLVESLVGNFAHGGTVEIRDDSDGEAHWLKIVHLGVTAAPPDAARHQFERSLATRILERSRARLVASGENTFELTFARAATRSDDAGGA
jgi:hypothetical protein